MRDRGGAVWRPKNILSMGTSVLSRIERSLAACGASAPCASELSNRLPKESLVA